MTANAGRSDPLDVGRMITLDEFAKLVRLSRRQLYRLRKSRPTGFPQEHDLASSASKYRRCPRFKLSEVRVWMASRAIW